MIEIASGLVEAGRNDCIRWSRSSFTHRLITGNAGYKTHYHYHHLHSIVTQGMCSLSEKLCNVCVPNNNHWWPTSSWNSIHFWRDLRKCLCEIRQKGFSKNVFHWFFNEILCCTQIISDEYVEESHRLVDSLFSNSRTA